MVFQKTYCTSGATWHSVFVFVFVLVFVFVCVFSLFCRNMEYVQPPLSASNPMILEARARARAREKPIVKARKRAREREKPKPKVKARAGAGILFHLSIPTTLNSHCSTCSRMNPKFIAGLSLSLSQKKVSAAALQRKMTVKLTTGTWVDGIDASTYSFKSEYKSI